MKYAASAAKALLAGAIAFTGTVATGYADDGVMVAAEWWGSASTALVAIGVVYGVPNLRRKP